MVSIAICVLTAALCLSSGFHQGYIANVLNQPYVAIESYINDSWIERYGYPIEQNTLNVIWSSLNIVFPTAGILGQFLAAYLCRRFGRKRTSLFSSFLYLPGIAISYVAKSAQPYFELLFIGRFIWSLANGIFTVTATVWIIECAPTKYRGKMAALQEVFMASGSLLCQAVGVPFSTEELWQYIFIPPFIISLTAIVTFCFTYESPQYIIDYEKNITKARYALAFYHGRKANCPSIEEELKMCAENLIKKEPQKSVNDYKEKKNSNGLSLICNVLKANDPKSRVIRLAAWLGVMVKIAYVFTGARCLRAYSTFVLHHMAKWQLSKALFLSFVIGFIRVPFTFAPVLLVERVGRRPLILYSMIISLIMEMILMTSIFIGESWKVGSFIGLAGLLLVNACGLGSISRFYSAELVPRSLLIHSVSFLTAAEAVTKISVEFAFFPIAHIAEGYSMLLFGFPTAVFTVLTWYYCPETKGKEVNEVLHSIAEKQNIQVMLDLEQKAVTA